MESHRSAEEKIYSVKTSASQKSKYLFSLSESPPTEFLALWTEAELLSYYKCPYSNAEIYVNGCVVVL